MPVVFSRPNFAILNSGFTLNQCVKTGTTLVDSESWTNNTPYIGNGESIALTGILYLYIKFGIADTELEKTQTDPSSF